MLPPPNIILSRIRAEDLSFYGQYLRTDLVEEAVKSVLNSRGISTEKRAAEVKKSILQDADPHQCTCECKMACDDMESTAHASAQAGDV